MMKSCRQIFPRAFTLIECLICIAILGIAFNALLTVTVTSYREGRFGAEDMMARQQVHLAGRALYRDIKNATAAPERLGVIAPGESILALEFPMAGAHQPVSVVYFTDSGRLHRRAEFANGNSNTVALVENLTDAEFARSDGLISWRVEAAVSFQDHTRRNAARGSARLGGAAR